MDSSIRIAETTQRIQPREVTYQEASFLCVGEHPVLRVVKETTQVDSRPTVLQQSLQEVLQGKNRMDSMPIEDERNPRQLWQNQSIQETSQGKNQVDSLPKEGGNTTSAQNGNFLNITEGLQSDSKEVIWKAIMTGGL